MIKSALAAAAAVVAALTLTPPASADADSQFIGSLNAVGIIGDPGALIAAGHAVCDQPLTFNTGLLAQAGAAGVPVTDWTPFAVASMRSYCPDKLHAYGAS